MDCPLAKIGYNRPVPPTSLFDTLPPQLFKPLASPQAEAYGRILSDLYLESRRATQPLSRDLVIDIIISQLFPSPAANESLSQAREMLQYLEACGWLRVEIQPDFTPACVLTPAAFQLLQLLGAESASISEVLITICDLLKAALLDVDNDARLREAARLTDQLLNQLKTAQHNPGQDPLPDTARLRLAVLDSALKLETRGHAPARYIREQFSALDRLLNDIAARQAHADRTPAAAHSPATREATARLNAILTHLASAESETFDRATDSLFCLYPQLVAQPLTRTADAPPRLPDYPTTPEPSAAEINAARRAVARQLNRPISPDRVRRLARTFLANKPEIRAADLVAAGQADLPLLVQLRLYGDGSLGYKIEDLPWVETNKLVFRDFALKNLDYTPPPEEPVISDN